MGLHTWHLGTLSQPQVGLSKQQGLCLLTGSEACAQTLAGEELHSGRPPAPHLDKGVLQGAPTLGQPHSCGVLPTGSISGLIQVSLKNVSPAYVPII